MRQNKFEDNSGILKKGVFWVFFLSKYIITVDITCSSRRLYFIVTEILTGSVRRILQMWSHTPSISTLNGWESLCKLGAPWRDSSFPWDGAVLLRKLWACRVTVHRNSDQRRLTLTWHHCCWFSILVRSLCPFWSVEGRLWWRCRPFHCKLRPGPVKSFVLNRMDSHSARWCRDCGVSHRSTENQLVISSIQ